MKYSFHIYSVKGNRFWYSYHNVIHNKDGAAIEYLAPGFNRGVWDEYFLDGTKYEKNIWKRIK